MVVSPLLAPVQGQATLKRGVQGAPSFPSSAHVVDKGISMLHSSQCTSDGEYFNFNFRPRFFTPTSTSQYTTLKITT